MAEINLSKLKEEKEKGKKEEKEEVKETSSSFSNGPTIVLSNGKATVEHAKTQSKPKHVENTQKPLATQPVVNAQPEVQTQPVQSNLMTPEETQQVLQNYGIKPVVQTQNATALPKGMTFEENQNAMLSTLLNSAGYIGEKALKGAPGSVASLGYLGGTLVDNAGSTLDYVLDKGSALNPNIKFANNLLNVADLLTKGKVSESKEALNENEILNNTAGLIKEKSKQVMDWSKESSYDPEQISTGVQLAGDVVGGISQMVPSILATYATGNPIVGKTMMSASAAGGALDESLANGASYEDAVTHALATGAAEYLLESLGGSIPGLGEGKFATLAKEFVEKNLKGPIGKQIVDLAIDALGEGAEEYLSSVIGEYLTDIYTDEKKKDDVLTRFMNVQDEALYSALIGGLTGAVMNVPRAVSSMKKKNQTATQELPQEQTNNITEGNQPVEAQKQPTENPVFEGVKKMAENEVDAEAAQAEQQTPETSEQPAEPKTDPITEGLRSDNAMVRYEAQRQNKQATIDSAKQNGVDTKKATKIADYANKVGVRVIYKDLSYTDADTGKVVKPEGMYQNGVIYLSPNTTNPMYQVFKHELTHFIETSELYQDFQNVIFSLYDVDTLNVMRENLRRERSDIVKEYQNDEARLAAEIDKELTAILSQDKIFTDKKTIDQLAQKKPNVAQKFLRWIKNKLAVARGEMTAEEVKIMETAEQLYREALENVKNKSVTERSAQKMYAGESARLADKNALELAKLMERFQRDKETIRQETGWIKKSDGKWRFEIDDSKAKFNFDVLKEKMFPTLKEVLDHPTLYENYPHLADIEVYFNSGDPSTRGAYNKTFDSIWLNTNISNDIDQLKSTLLHEVQHAVQHYEGFEGGAALNVVKARMEDERFRTRFIYEHTDGFREDYNEYKKLQENYKELTKKYGGEENVPKELYNKIIGEIGSSIVQADFKYGVNSFSEYSKAIKPVDDLQVYDRYLNVLGEVEARDTAERREYDDEDRRIMPPKTEGDVTGSKSNTSLSKIITKDGEEVIVLDKKNTHPDGTPMTEKELYKAIRNKTYTLSDGSNVEIVGYLYNVSGNKDSHDMYGELFRKLPGNQITFDEMKNLRSKINNNFIEVLGDSKYITTNPDNKPNHKNYGIVDFDLRDVNIFDGDNAYKLRLAIANLKNGKKVAYAKQYLFGPDKVLTEKIKKETGHVSVNHENPISTDSISDSSNKASMSTGLNADQLTGKITIKDGISVLNEIKNKNFDLEDAAFDISDFISDNKDRMDEKTYNIFEKRMEMYAAGFDSQAEFREAKNISANYLSFNELEEMLKEHEELKHQAWLEAIKKNQRTTDELNKQNFYIKKITEERAKAFEMSKGLMDIKDVPNKPITNQQKLLMNRVESIRYNYSDGNIHVYAADRIGNLVDTGYYTVDKLADKFGSEVANRIVNNLSPIEKVIRDFKKYNDAISEEVINETTKLAKKKFGVTSNPYEAGYMTLDGKWLDFSDKKNGAPAGTRNNDHIEASFSNGVEMNDFIKMGNIRLQPESSGFQILKEPTVEQQKSLLKYLKSLNKTKEGYFIGFGDPNSPTRNADYLVFKPTDKPADIMKAVNDHFNNTAKQSRGLSASELLGNSKDPAVRARAQMEKRIRGTFLFNAKSDPRKMYEITSRLEHEFNQTGKISTESRQELFNAAYNETLKNADITYKELPEFVQMIKEDLNRAVTQYENTLIKERELLKFAQKNDIPVSEVKLNPTFGYLRNVKPEDLPDKIISYKKLKASLKSDLVGQVDNYAGGKQIDELIDQAAKEILEDGYISSTTKFKIRQEMIENGYSINDENMRDNKELYDFIKSTKFNVPRGFGREIQDFDRTRKLLKTSTTEGRPIDQVYNELRGKFGEFFPDALTNPADQYQQIYEVMAELEPVRIMMEDSEQYNAEMRQYLEDTFTDRLEDFKNQVVYRSQKDYYDRAAKKQVAQDSALNQISEAISEKFFKDNKEIDELKKTEDVIKSKVSIDELAQVVAKIRDRGALSKTLAQNLDAMAGGDVVLRAQLAEIFEKPLREAKRNYVTNQKRVLDDVYQRITQDLGIKMGSKESAAMMWYGEGKKQLNKVKGKVESDKLEFTQYTLDDLKKDFPDTWENIVEADSIMRKYYDEYVDRINQSLEKIYSERNLKESVAERRTELQKELREAMERLEEYKAQRQGEVGTPDVEARINAQRERIKNLSTQFNNVAEDVYRNKRLNKRSDYYHHFQDIGMVESIQEILKGDSANNISNALAGISEHTKPKSKWASFMQKRSDVARYEEDAIKGFLKYAPAAEYKIAFDPYVAQMRGTIQDIIKLSDEANINNAKAINWLTNYTNSLAGKTNPLDRWVANTQSGRAVLQLLNKVNSRVKANAVAGNLNSAVSQFYNLPNGIAVLTDNGGVGAQIDLAKGSKDYAAYAAMKMAGQDVSSIPINQSVFLAERYIDSTISQFDESILSKPQKAATFMLTFGDQVVAEQLWFSAYNQAQRLGKSDPIAYADDIVQRCVAGRGVGEIPLAQQSQVVKLIAPFQVEVNNAWQLMKQMGSGALKDKDKALGMLLMYAATWLMNEINQALTGNRVGMDIFNAMQDAAEGWDSEKNVVSNTFTAAGRLGGEVLSNVPMGAQIAQMIVSDEYDREKLFGEADPSRYGTGNIGINAVSDPLIQLATKQNVDWQSLVTNFATPYGGKQLNRLYKLAEDTGIIPRIDFNTEDLLQVSKKPGAYTEKGQLKYPIDTSDPANWAMGLMFGTYATKEGKEYIREGYSALSDAATEKYEDLVEYTEADNKLAKTYYDYFRQKEDNSLDNAALIYEKAMQDAIKHMIEKGPTKTDENGVVESKYDYSSFGTTENAMKAYAGAVAMGIDFNIVSEAYNIKGVKQQKGERAAETITNSKAALTRKFYEEKGIYKKIVDFCNHSKDTDVAAFGLANKVLDDTYYNEVLSKIEKVRKGKK